MRQPSCSRRELLRGGAAAATAGLAGLAGCSAVESVVDGDPDVPEYATWLPAPARVYEDDTDDDDLFYIAHARRFDLLAPYLDAHGEAYARQWLYQDGKAHPVVDVDPADAGLEVRPDDGLSMLETNMPDEAVIEAFRTPESGNRSPTRSSASASTRGTDC
ncbi:hypothetical protein ACFQRB_05620 [Halobaculum litoreum]|uniref:Tat (Twin-arginine translocation) pathway signal sequence n=1 Tax=Halobaculum litoreum TaxID=3031998 RepID=A0ABD5XLX7_9EURY